MLINKGNKRTESTRLVWLDNLKAFLILLVILGHAIQLLNPYNYQHDVLFRYIYSFHMPLFIFVSGYACFRRELQWSLVKKRFFQLIIPFSLWSIVLCIINCDYRIWLLFVYPERSLWFLYVLFFVTFFHLVCRWLARKTHIKEELLVAVMAILFFASMFFFRLFGWPIIAKYFMFYCMGFYARKNFRFEQQSIILTVLLLALFLIAAFFCMQDAAPSFMTEGSSSMYKYPYNLLVAVLGIAAFMLLFANAFKWHNTLFTDTIGGVLWGCMRFTGLWVYGLRL